MDIQYKIAVVTGASRGLGQRVAVTLAEHGARVALVARSETHLNETARMIASRIANGSALVIPADLGDPAAADHIKAEVEKNLGKPAILINAAGIFGPFPLIKGRAPTAPDETVHINMIGPDLLVRPCLHGLSEAG